MANVNRAQDRKLQKTEAAAGLRIRLLGPVSIEIDGEPVVIASKKARALLGYLVQRQGADVARGILTGLLWGERSEAQARASLRQTLSELRRTLAKSPQPPLIASKEAIAWRSGSAWTDTKTLEAAAGSQDDDTLRDAVDLIRGDFMEGLSVDEATFEQWLAAERERFRLLACDIHVRLMDRAERTGGLEEALNHGLKLVSIDPLREHVHRALMRLYAAQGRHDAALAQYERCKRELSSQLGVQPERETESLARSIRTSRRDGPAKPEGQPSPALPDKPSIAVLPFANLSGTPEQEFFSDGITEDIITELCRYKSLFVVARNSSFVFRARSADLREVGMALGVLYVLEGSVRRAGDRIRVTVQLINIATSESVWADRYDGDIGDVFSLQDEISRTIVSTIADRLEASHAERIKQRPTHDLSAYEHVLRGQKFLHQYTQADYEHARDCFQQAIQIDPNFARAHALLAMVEVYCWFWDDNPSRLARAVSIGETALALDPHESKCHLALGVAHLFRATHERAGYHLTHAAELNPNDDLIMVENGRYRMYAGQPDDGADRVQQAMRRNPYHPNWYWNVLGRCLHSAGEFETAIPVFERVTSPQFWTHAYLAACYSAVGNAGKAAEHRARTLALRPDFTVSGFSGVLPYRNPSDLLGFLETLRRAGFSR